MVYCTLKQYLSEIEAIEKTKVATKRKYIPTLQDIANAIGLSYSAVSRIANNRVKRLDYRTAAKIIDAVRAHGHDMQIQNIIGYKPLPA